MWRPMDLAGRFRAVDRGQWRVPGVPTLATRAPHEQTSGPMDVGCARRFQRTETLRDGAQAEDGQVAVPAAIDAPWVFLDERDEAVVV